MKLEGILPHHISRLVPIPGIGSCKMTMMHAEVKFLQFVKIILVNFDGCNHQLYACAHQYSLIDTQQQILDYFFLNFSSPSLPA